MARLPTKASLSEKSSGRKSAGGRQNRTEQDRDPRIPDAGHSGRRRPDEDGGRRHLRHRRQALQAPAAQQAHHHGPREHRLSSPRPAASSPQRKGFKEGDLVFVEHYVSCGKCEWCHAGQYRHCENTNWRTNPDAIRYGYTSDEKPPHLWGGFAQYMYLPWNAVIHHVPKGVTPELAGLVTPMANGVEWSLFDGERRLQLHRPHSGPGPAGPVADRDLQAGRRVADHRHRHRRRTGRGWRSPRSSAPTT